MRDKYLGCWDLENRDWSACTAHGRVASVGCCGAAGLSPVSLTWLPPQTPGHRSGDRDQSLPRGRSWAASPAHGETPTSGRADSTAGPRSETGVPAGSGGQPRVGGGPPYLHSACRRPPAGSRRRRNSGRSPACSRTCAGRDVWVTSSTRSHLQAAGAGAQEGRGAWMPAPTPTPGRGGTQGPKGARGRKDQSRKQPGHCRETEGRTDRHSRKARNEGNRNREGSLSWADTPREGQAGGQSKAGWGLGQAGTAGGTSQPPAPPTNAGAAEGVPLEARLAVAAVGAGEVVAHLALAAAVHTRLTLVHVCRGRPAGHAEARALPPAEAATPRAPRRAEAVGGAAGLTHTLGPVLAGVVAAPTDHRIPLARVGAHRVDAAEAGPTRLGERCALIDVCGGGAGDREPGAAPPGAPGQPRSGPEGQTPPVPVSQDPRVFPPRSWALLTRSKQM